MLIGYEPKTAMNSGIREMAALSLKIKVQGQENWLTG